jgi:hypothetical protein
MWKEVQLVESASLNQTKPRNEMPTGSAKLHALCLAVKFFISLKGTTGQDVPGQQTQAEVKPGVLCGDSSSYNVTPFRECSPSNTLPMNQCERTKFLIDLCMRRLATDFSA